MHKMVSIWLVGVWVSPAFALDRSQIQIEAETRIWSATDQYAASIGADKDIVSYCRMELDIHRPSSENGSVPFGIDYNTASDDTVRLAVRLRESHAIVYLKLCIAEAKAKLRAVYLPH